MCLYIGGPSGKDPTWQRKRRKRHRFTPWSREDPLEEGMATHSSILAWRSPMDRGAWRATVHAVEELDTTEANDHARVCTLVGTIQERWEL